MNLIKQTVAPLFVTLLAGLAGVTLGACDLSSKDIGDETQGGDAGSGDGDMCTEGDTKPDEDGCNTCECDADGSWACTEIACADDGGDGGACMPGDTKPDEDGCNTCMCDDDGTWACTLIGCGEDGSDDGMDDSTDGGECMPGDTMPADDGCNTCECDDDGSWACTEIACAELPVCQDPVTSDAFEILEAAIVGDELQVTVQYSGGCAEHAFDMCWDAEWLESNPVQTGLTIAHADPGDKCDALPTEERTFDLLPLQLEYAAVYSPTGTLFINLAGWDSGLAYSF